MNFNYEGKSSLIILLGNEISKLCGVESVKDGKWYGKKYTDVVSDKNLWKDTISKIEIKHHDILKTILKYKKDNVKIYDLSGFLNHSDILPITDINTPPSIEDGKVKMKLNFDTIIADMFKSDFFVYIGENAKEIDFSLFLDDFSKVKIISNDKFDKKYENCEILDEISVKNVKKALDSILKVVNKEYNNYKRPYGFDVTPAIIKELNNDNKEFNFGYDEELVKKIIEKYPFLKKLKGEVIENFWKAYMLNTGRYSNHDKIEQEDYFLDMFLVYSVYKWKDELKLSTGRPKVSLTKAFVEKNPRDVDRFKRAVLLDKKRSEFLYMRNRALSVNVNGFVKPKFKSLSAFFRYYENRNLIDKNEKNEFKKLLSFKGNIIGNFVENQEYFYKENDIYSFLKDGKVINTNLDSLSKKKVDEDFKSDPVSFEHWVIYYFSSAINN